MFSSLFSLVYSNPLLKKLEAFRLLFTTFPVTPALLKYVLVAAVLYILFYVNVLIIYFIVLRFRLAYANFYGVSLH